ncbi:MAG: hypothetical protein ACFFAH_15885 [Promethearchaeota archaeon]
MKNLSNFDDKSLPLKMLGIGLMKISVHNLDESFEIIFQKGIGMPLIQDILELYKKEIVSKKQGNSIIPVDNFTLFMHYFEHQDDIIILIFMDEKEDTLSYSQLYLLTKLIKNKFQLNPSLKEIKKLLNERVALPRSEGVSAVLILSASGTLFISSISEKREIIAQKSVTISGFISALFSFSQEIIGKETGAKLKEINFGNQLFYVIVKDKVIFAFLVDKASPLLQRYMYLIVDEFFEKYQEIISNFNGDVTPFEEFKIIIDQYFLI